MYQRKRATDRRILRFRGDNDHAGLMLFAVLLTWVAAAGLLFLAVWVYR